MKKAAGSKKNARFCIQTSCRQTAVNQGYCRLHYIQNWRLIKLSRQVKAEQRLNEYVDKLTKKYPKDFLERLKEGLENEDKFKETVSELEAEAEAEGNETEREFLEKFLRSIKGDE